MSEGRELKARAAELTLMALNVGSFIREVDRVCLRSCTMAYRHAGPYHKGAEGANDIGNGRIRATRTSDCFPRGPEVSRS